MQTPSEVSHLGNIFFACLLIGIILIIPAVWLHEMIMNKLIAAGNPPEKWVRDATGILFAIFPAFVLALSSVRYLDKRYPDSEARRIPEPHERPSANRR